MRVQCTCRTCGTTFSVPQCRIEVGSGRYCSRACYYAAVARPSTDTWTCSRCGVVKPIEQFPRHGNGRRDRFCKSCHSARIRAKYAADPSYAEIYRRAARESYGDEWRRARKDLRDRAYRAAQPSVGTRSTKAYKQRHPQRIAAHDAVRRALRSGRLIRETCQLCGIRRTHAHHHRGYAPEHHLDVVWLCPAHHRAVHPFNTLT